MGHSAQTRNDAVERMRGGETLASVHHDTGIPRQTLSRWASDAGVDLGHTAEKTRAAAEARLAKGADRRAELADALLAVAEAALPVEVDRILDGTASLHEIVGARTRAIHDMQLITGAATGRTEYHDLAAQIAEMADAEVPRLRAVG